MKKFLLLWLLQVLFVAFIFAKPIDVETAKLVAKNAYYIKYNNLFEKNYNSINLSWVYTEYYNNEPVYYIFNVNNTEGFVIISADDIAKPLIAFSYEGPFPISNQPPHFAEWMKGYKEQIVYAKTNNLKANTEIQNEWAKYLTTQPQITKEKATQPLLIHTWNQDWPWNAYCPVDANGPGGHVYAGCVAVAMAQLMKFYNYPNNGTGTHTNYSFWNGGYGDLTVNYANQTYHWYNMPNLVNSYNYDEVAKLLYHCSVAVDMNYSPDGSGSQTSKIPTALETYYFYSTDAQYIQKSSYADATWKNILKQQIDNKRPMAYQGSGADGGHAWNCDGYNGDLFHMNWGWSGSANGYYDLSSLVAGGYDFTSSQGAVINVYPANNYPQGCNSVTITGRGGAFNDGSGNQNYQKNLNCTYLIQPECASLITLQFDRFDLGAGDHVIVYDGANTSSPVLGDFTSSNTPGTTILSSSGDALLIQFITDGTDENYGWYASYNTNTCLGTKYLNNLNGSVEDGSKNCNYDPNRGCIWYLQPAGATNFHLDFVEFDFPVADDNDYVKVYKNTMTTSNLIGTYKGSSPPPSSVDIEAQKVIIRFVSNSSDEGGGFKINYSAIVSGIENQLANYKTSVFPNPINEYTNINFDLPEGTNKITIQIENIVGQQIANYTTTLSSGNYNIPLKSIIPLSQLSNGIYLLRLKINENEAIYKLFNN